MFRTTIKGLFGHKGRLVSTMLAIIIGVSFMAGTLVFTDTIGKTFDDLFASTTQGDAFVRSTNTVKAQGPGDAQRGLVDEALLEKVQRVDGVRAAAGQISGYAQFVDKNGKAMGNPGQGAPTFGFNWTGVPGLNSYTLVEGDAPQGADRVVIDKASATKGNFAVGDPIRVLTKTGSNQMTVSGIVKFGDADAPLGASVALFDTATAQKLVGQAGKFNLIAALAADGVSQSALADRVKAAVSGPVEVIGGQAYVEEQQKQAREGFGFFTTFLLAFAFISLFVGAFYISNTFTIVVAQRTKEMALLRALGASRRQVLGSVLIEAVVVGTIASLLGLVFGVIVSVGLRAMLKGIGIDIPATGIVIVPGSMISAFLVGLIITVVSSFLPARRAARVSPMAALRDIAIDRSSTSKIRLALGGIVTLLGAANLFYGLSGAAPNAVGAVGGGAAMTLLGVAVLGPVIARPVASVLGSPVAALRGVSGRLARENSIRNPRRTASTAAALMIGVAMVGCVAILASSLKASFEHTIDKNFHGDVIVDSGDFSGQSGLSPTVAQQLRQIPELSAVSAVRQAQVEIGGEGKFALAADPATIDQIVDLEVTEGAVKDLGADGIGVYDKSAADRNLHLGDTLTVKFPNGERAMKVVVLYKRQDFGGEFMIGLPAHDAGFPNPVDYQIYTKVRPGTDVAPVVAKINAITANYPTAKVQDITEFKRAQLAPFDQILALIYGLLMIAIMIAILGIVNTLSLSIFERTRELGLLRAVGMSRRQLRSTVRWESVIIAIFGTLLGLVVGTFFGWAIVRALKDQGLEAFVVPVGQLIVLTILAGFVGVGAGLWPSFRASRLNILDAIDAE